MIIDRRIPIVPGRSTSGFLPARQTQRGDGGRGSGGVEGGVYISSRKLYCRRTGPTLRNSKQFVLKKSGRRMTDPTLNPSSLS